MSIAVNKFTDAELLQDIANSQKSISERAFQRVYNNCKKKCLGFLKINGAPVDEAEDIYQDAVIVFYEKVLDKSYTQQSSIQVYLNSICRYHWLNRIRDNREIQTPEDFDFDKSITDWHIPYDGEKEEKINRIEQALQKMKEAGGNCYSILYGFFYEKKSMEDIAQAFNYTDADNAKQQKARCQKRLKEMINGK